MNDHASDLSFCQARPLKLAIHFTSASQCAQVVLYQLKLHKNGLAQVRQVGLSKDAVTNVDDINMFDTTQAMMLIVHPKKYPMVSIHSIIALFSYKYSLHKSIVIWRGITRGG